ncbi:hypothetical protein BBAD15_g6512 [Beauveria bassiana D1-5]|uniref:Rhodopsin domain-containing protein n=1 Tax=Beauveria bassiana D1-5 TaxID=1245745 RepID=A0A0A2VP78_BEABA|nr:hypothetical protein BBAD15_g6512 [Beauveria bassiana D1-5]
MLQPREIETPFNKSPLVRAVTAFLMVFSILAVVTRIATRLLTAGSLKSRRPHGDCCDIVIVLGANGFGQHNYALSDAQTSTILKCLYASGILYIVTLGVTKISACMTVMNVAPLGRRRGIFFVMGAIGVWAVASVVVVIFQCQISSPWNFYTGKCVDLPAFWLFFEILNILTDLATIVAMMELVWNIQAQKSMKSLVIFIFGSRVLIIPAAICHIIYLKRAVTDFKSTGDTFAFWPPVIIRQVVQCLSIATACIPYLKPFLDNLESGQMRAGDALMYMKSGSGHSGNKSGNKSADRKKTTAASGSRTVDGPSSSAHKASSSRPSTKPFELSNMANTSKGPNVTTTIMHDDAQPSWDGQSQSSQTVLVQQSWRVDVEARPQSQA